MRMPWFKHHSASTLFLDGLEREFKDAGYCFWYKMLELFATHGNAQGELRITLDDIAKKLHKSKGKVRQLLDYCGTKGKLSFNLRPTFDFSNSQELIITCSEFIDLLANYNKYGKKSSKDIQRALEEPERRREREEKENRLEEKRERVEETANRQEVSQELPPSFDEVKSYFINEKGSGIAESQKFYSYYSARSWRTKDGVFIAAWRPLADSWLLKVPQFDKLGNSEKPVFSAPPTEKDLQEIFYNCSNCGRNHRGDEICPKDEDMLLVPTNGALDRLTKQMGVK